MNVKKSKLKLTINQPAPIYGNFLKRLFIQIISVLFVLPLSLFAQNPDSPCNPGDIGSNNLALTIPTGITDIWDSTSGNLTIGGDITIESGATLVIRDITVFFTNQTRIVVENGGHLILDRARLTVYCKDLLWEGIQVWGDQNKPHPKTVIFDPSTNSSLIISDGDLNTNDDGDYHGIVYMKNNSLIEHARAGIHTMKYNSWNPDYPSQGKDHTQSNGIVIARASYFINNLCSIILLGDNNQTSCDIFSCFFEANANFHAASISDPANFDPDVQLWFENVVGLKIYYTRFRVSDLNLNGKNAIECHNSTFDYLGGENAAFESSIYNYERGIQAFYSSNNQQTQTKVENVKFDHTPLPMVFSGYKNLTDNGDGVTDRADLALLIKNNKINLPIAYSQYNDPNPQAPDSKRSAIRLEACYNYIVSDNEVFGGYRIPDGNGFRYIYHTIDVSESENPGNLSYNYIQNNIIGNDNSHYFIGIYAFEDNPTLQILCNTFNASSSVADIVFDKGNGTIIPAYPLQGNCGTLDTDNPETAPAGNIFSANIPLQALGGGYDIFYYHINSISPQFNGNIIRRICGNISSVNCLSYTNDEFYEVVGGGGGTPVSNNCCILARTDHMDIETEMQNAMNLLTKYNRKDDNALIEVATSMRSVFAIIDNYDLYLSDSELEAVIGKLTFSTARDVFNILEENAPLSNNVLHTLSNQINSFTLRQQLMLNRSYGRQINDLYENRNGMSLRHELESEVYQLSITQKYLPPANLGCCRMAPSEILSELQEVVDNTDLNKVWFQQVLVDRALSLGLYSEALDAISQIDTRDNEDLTDYVALQQFYISMQQEGKSLDDLNEKEVEQLENIANNNTASGISARNAILALNDSIPTYYTPEITLEENLEEPIMPVNPLLNLRISSENKLVYPIPAKDVLFVNTNLLNIKEGEIAVNMYNLNGILIESFKANLLNNNSIDVSKISQGAYFVELINSEQKLIERSKVLIIK